MEMRDVIVIVIGIESKDCKDLSHLHQIGSVSVTSFSESFYLGARCGR